MYINDLHSQDWTLKEIAAETGFHPATIKKHLANGGPPKKRAVADDQLVMNAHWQARIDELIAKWPRLLGSVCSTASEPKGSVAAIRR